MSVSISVAFWGTRGTIPTPGPGTTRYGGNTACIAVSDGDGRSLILDAGTGIRALGQSLAGNDGNRLDLFLSHVHWDHIQGLPFFEPMYRDGQDIHIHGPTPDGISLETVLERQLDPAVYPVPRAARPARVTVHEIDAGATREVPGFRVRSTALSHPGGALGYRIEPASGGPVVAYLTDNELGAGGASRVPSTFRDDLDRFLDGAALLVHDAMYTPALLAERPGWGHSSALEAVALATSAGVPQLALFHHEPEHDDRQLDDLLATARGAAPAGLTVDAAHEGWTVVL